MFEYMQYTTIFRKDKVHLRDSEDILCGLQSVLMLLSLIDATLSAFRTSVYMRTALQPTRMDSEAVLCYNRYDG